MFIIVIISKHTFREGLLTTWRLWQEVTAFRYGLSSETNAFLGVKDRAFPDQRLDSASPAVDLVKGDLADHLGSIT